MVIWGYSHAVAARQGLVSFIARVCWCGQTHSYYGAVKTPTRGAIGLS